MKDMARVVADSGDHARFMRLAIELAERGSGQVAPNPKVGAVIVKDGEIVGEGWHQRYGDAHAEVNALAQAGDRARGATAYVTLEPCNHTGKTGPCTEALIAAGVARVVCAVRDPNAIAAGGLERLAAAGIEVEHGLLADEASWRIAPFLAAARGSERPFVTLKLAISLDGAIVGPSRKRAWLTGPESQELVHHMRADADAVAVGIGTALADNPSLTVRHGVAPRVAPIRVVFDRQARLPLSSALVSSAAQVPVVVVAAPEAPGGRIQALQSAGVTIQQSPGLEAALQELHQTGVRQNGVRHLFVEGGAELASALMTASLVDQLIIFQAPVILGAGAIPAFATMPGREADVAPRLQVLERRVLGNDLMTRYAV
ncbi:MAG: bifunctional diaminohydroxyphosphoribosylaminopyrimidine deaminase/5-amino-6-(5-phosphoribosylamino)uracil reductase RibD [Gemmatimonadaceae bacterium]|nr:bifunctional diaminohydroxyphosphoribosylaminopyrimidine deaminase/5-amino-6-(5-phosphoribosylamino)uracil reductase RibD [Gemmatimonadaceae bacterium]